VILLFSFIAIFGRSWSASMNFSLSNMTNFYGGSSGK
jgi:hypothetical protein